MCNAFFQVIFRSVAAAASSVLLIQGINQILCQPNRISARPQRTPAGLAPPPARYLLVCGTAACFSSILLMELSFFSWRKMAALGNSWIPSSGLRPPAFGAIGNQTTGMLRAASSYCLSDATVCAEFIFYARRGAAAGAGPPPAFALGPSPLPAQSDGFKFQKPLYLSTGRAALAHALALVCGTALAPFALTLFLLTSCECLSDMPSVYLVSSMGGNLSGSSTYVSSPPAGKSTHSLSAV